MDTEDSVVDDHTEGKEVEHVGKILPDRRRPVFPCTFKIEAVGL